MLSPTLPSTTLLISLVTAATSPLTGPVQAVHDGDTIRVAGVPVRIWGIDAPELSQTCQSRTRHDYACGKEARAALVALIGNRPVVCAPRDNDRYGRVVAACSAGGRDLGEDMVRCSGPQTSAARPDLDACFRPAIFDRTGHFRP